MELPVIFMVVALVAALCSAQPVATSEPEQPRTSGHLRLKRQAPSIINNYGECSEGQIKVKTFCMDEDKYWQEYDDSEPEQPRTSGVFRLKRQAPLITDASGRCPPGQTDVKGHCLPNDIYLLGKSDYAESEQPHTSEVLRRKGQAPKPSIIDLIIDGLCPEGRTNAKGLCIPNEVYWESKGEYDDSQEE